jgi:ribonuclease P protein component
MLPKRSRIERKYFKEILIKGKRYNSKSFTLYLSKNDQGGDKTLTKVAFSVSKKVVKTAVGRNKQRRRGYSITSSYINQLKPGYLLFFVYKKDFEKDYTALKQEIFTLLSTSLMIR